MAEAAEIAALTEILHEQQVTIEKLQWELEMERRAAATGTEEALTMILRLQEEKSAVKTEASQFRRMVEEKMQHDEESLAFLKGVMFHQEMELSSLKFQLQAYKNRLLYTLLKDPFTAIDPALRNSRFSHFSKKNISLPATRLEELFAEAADEGDGLQECDASACSADVQDKFEVCEVHDYQGTSLSGEKVANYLPLNDQHCRRNKSMREVVSRDMEEADIGQMKSRVQNLENVVFGIKEACFCKRCEEVGLMKQIAQKLDAIHSCVLRSKEHYPRARRHGEMLVDAEYCELLMNLLTVEMLHISV